MVVYGLTASEDGALATERALVTRGYSPVRLTADPGPAFRMSGVRYRGKTSLRGVWSFLRAGTVFTSHALFGGRAGGQGQRTVLLWHGEVVKPVGLLDGDRALPADVAPVCSSVGRAFRCAEFGLAPEAVPVVGAPRNDRLLTAGRGRVRERLGWADEAVVWLWLPTYRTSVRGDLRSDSDTSGNGLPFDHAALQALDRLLDGAGITVVVKPHPLSEQLIEGSYHNLVVLTQQGLDAGGVSLYEALGATDGLITDVSSVWVDYLLTEKPMLFAFPDLDQYRERRGFNLEPYADWVPGPVVADVESSAEALVRLPDDQDARRQRLEMKRRLHVHHDGASAERLLDLLHLAPGPAG